MISSYIPVVTIVTLSSVTSEAATAYPIPIPQKHYNGTVSYSNTTVHVSSTLMTSEKPYETTYLPTEESHPPAPATTNAPEYPAVAAACPPATVYETVTETMYE
jgi:hypothetical protein